MQEETQGEESDDVLQLGGIDGVEKWLRKVCDVQRASPPVLSPGA